MFRDQPIKFVTTTATAIGKMKRSDALAKLSRLCMAKPTPYWPHFSFVPTTASVASG